MRIRTFAVAFAMTALLGAACASDDSTVTDGSGETDTGSGTGEGGEGEGEAGDLADAERNDADVEFAQGMIPHHAQALEMTALAADRAESEDVLDLAGRIEAAQAPEIEEMTGWLEAWEEDVPDTSGAMTMDEGDGAMGDGMMSPEDMASLEAASGAEFDVLFLEFMTAHHEGAVAMAETELAEGEFADAKALAENIIVSQEAEIEEMAGLLTELS